MALSNLGVVSGTVIAPVQSYIAGTYAAGPESIAPGFSSVLVLLDLRNVASLTAKIDVSTEYSIDAGANWIFAGGAAVDIANSGYTLPGGILTNAEGGPVRIVGLRMHIPRTDLTRQVRITFVLNETMTVGATVVAW